MAAEEDPELISHEHTKTSTTYRATTSESDLKTGRRYFPQEKI